MDFVEVYEGQTSVQFNSLNEFFQRRKVTPKLPKVDKEQILTYVDTINFLLSSYAKHSDIPKVPLETAASEKTPIETSVQFGEVFFIKVVCCENTFLVERTMTVFTDGLSANNLITVRLFLSRKQEMHFSKITQYADTLLELTTQIQSLVGT